MKRIEAWHLPIAWLVPFALRSIRAVFRGTIRSTTMLVLCLTLAALVCSLSGACVAQSSTAHCNNSLERFLGVLEEAEKLKDPNFGSKDWDKEFEQWKREFRAEWRKVVDMGRQYLGECPNESTSIETGVLENIATGLKHLDQREDAIPILQHCLSIDRENSSCWRELGEVEMELCRFDDAKEAFGRVVEIGGFTTLYALNVDMAKSSLKMIDDPTSPFRTRICPEGASSSKEQASRNTRFGSGFFVTKQGHILTNNHVVEGCRSLATSDGKVLTMIDRDARLDLALLKADVNPDTVATFRGGQSPKPGDEVIAFGFPLPGILASEGNVSTGVLSATAGLQNDIRFVQISAPVQPGNSGGPLLDASGHVIGVVVAKLDAVQMARLTGDVPQNVNFAVHWATVRAFLDEKSVDYRQAPSSNSLPIHDIAAQAKRFSVGIVCAE